MRIRNAGPEEIYWSQEGEQHEGQEGQKFPVRKVNIMRCHSWGSDSGLPAIGPAHSAASQQPVVIIKKILRDLLCLSLDLIYWSRPHE
jgi:hypothetical protein